MKSHQITKILLLVAGSILFNLLFWKENLGLNLLIYSTLLMSLSIFLHPKSLTSRGVLIAFAGVLITGSMIVYHNSLMAKIVHFTSLFVFVGFVNQPQLRAIFHALPTGMLNLIHVPQMIIWTFSTARSVEVFTKRYWRTIKLILIPLLVFIIFYLIFHASNPVFAEFSDEIWSAIGNWFAHIFKNISLPWILLLIAGMLATGWFVFKATIPYFSKLEENLSDTIVRKKAAERTKKGIRFKSMISLKNEFRSALFLIVSINALLFVVNLIDIKWLWFNFEYNGKMNLSSFVHEGTYLLILSILLSMGILLYFFQKNLNFFPRNKLLVLFATIWIFQNLILVISVGVRNYYYIHYFGLAYKRIGVIFFLIATLVGLVTLFIKILKAKTSYYLLRVNSWNVYGILIFMSLINWDVIIANHNVKHTIKRNIDVEFLLSLSDKTLPIIDANLEKFDLDGRYNYRFGTDYQTYLDRRIELFMERKERTTRKSWNYSEQKAYEYFKSKE